MMGFTQAPHHPAPLATLGGRGLADAVSSPASATHEQERLAGIRKMHRQVAKSRVIPALPKNADLRDGGLMPRAEIDRSAVLFWLLMLAGGCAFWIWVLPKIWQEFVETIVAGATLYH